MRLSRFTVLALGAVLLAGCSDRSGDAAAGGTLVIAVGGSDVASLLPPFVTDITGKQVSDQLFLRLAQIDDHLGTIGDASFRPELARSWSWSRDSLSVAFTIDPRAQWHDGTPVTARDVAFTFAVLKDPKTATQTTATIANVDSVTIRDSLTAVVWFHRRTPEQFYDAACQAYILPAHLLDTIPHDRLSRSAFNLAPLGNGRFRFAKLETGGRVEIVADTTHYLGRPKLDRVIWAFNSDASAALTQVMSGQMDIYENIPPDVIAQLDSTKPIRAVSYPGLQYAYFGMNQGDPKRKGSPHPLFGDARVRRAIFMALDRQAMLRNVFDTLGVLGAGPYPRALSDSSVQLPPFDRGHAAALLDSAGWKVGANGVRSKNGKPFAFSLMTPTSSRFRMSYAVLIQEQLKSIGANVTLESIDINAFIAKQDAHTFDAGLFATGVDPSRAAIKQNWSREGLLQGGQNYVQYVNPVVDALIDSSLATFDAGKGNQYYHRAVQMLVNDVPAVWLYDPLTIAGIHKRIRPAPMRADAWWIHLADWSIPRGERIDRDRIGLRPAAQ